MMKNDVIRKWVQLTTINESQPGKVFKYELNYNFFCHVQNAPIIPNALDPYLKYHGVPSSGRFAWFGLAFDNNPMTLSCNKYN